VPGCPKTSSPSPNYATPANSTTRRNAGSNKPGVPGTEPRIKTAEAPSRLASPGTYSPRHPSQGQVNVELIAPAVGGSDGNHAPADQKIDGGPSVLYDAVILTDDGFVSLDEHSAADFISRCARLRFWPRQAGIAHRAGTATASAGQA
jgi:hypothetical protein